MTSTADPLQTGGAPATVDAVGQKPGTDVPGLVAASASRGPMIDVLVWMSVAAVLLLLRVFPGMVPDLYPDSFQYFSVADHALTGQFGYTSLLHFDAERSFGTIPAPSVTTAPGFPVTLALVSLTGLSIQATALLVSVASTLACVPLLAWIAGQVGLSRPLRNIVLGCFVLNAAVIQFGTSALSEALFTFVVLLGLTLLVAARRSGLTARWWLWAGAGLALGGAYLVRYAGLFLVIGLGVLVVRYLVSSNRALARGHAVALAVASLPVLAGMARNVALVGDWRGGNEKAMDNPWVSVLLDLGRGAIGPFVGSAPGTVILRGLFVAVFLAAIAWLFWNYVRRGDRRGNSTPVAIGIMVDFLLLAAVYVAGLFYAGLFSVIPPNPRYFAPLTPMILLILGIALQNILPTSRDPRISQRLPVVILAGSLCLYLTLNVIAYRQPQVDDASVVASQMDAVAGDGTSARTAVRDHLGANEVIVANNGQAVGFVLGLPTVSLVGPHFSTLEWDEVAVQKTVRRFDAGVVVISVPPPALLGDDDYLPSAFVRRLAVGDAPPWLRLVHRSSDVLVYVPSAIVQ